MKQLCCILLFSFIGKSYIFAQSPNNVFEVANYNKKVLLGYPHIYYTFKENKDTTLYNASVKEVRVYQQYKKPFISDERFVFINPSLQFEKIDLQLKKRWLNIEALKYYIDTATFVMDAQKRWATIETYLPYHALYAPFYMLKTEVSNKEYREFVTYVRDSIALTLLANGGSSIAGNFCTHDANEKMHLRWDKPIPWGTDEEDIKLDLSALYLPDSLNFYNRRQIDIRKLNYEYRHHPSSALPDADMKDIVNIYPDTLCWAHDFYFLNSIDNSFEPYVNMYNWHPAYDDYPVVGITFPQIRAFLHWKTEQLQKQLDKKGAKFLVECDLPNELEWETVNCASLINNSVTYYTSSYYDGTMLPDLYYKMNPLVTLDTGKLAVPETKQSKEWVGGKVFLKDSLIETEIFNYVRLAPTIEQERLFEYARTNHSYTTTKMFTTASSNKQSFTENNTSNGIVYYTHNNISEWMRETYFEPDTNYKSYKYFKKKSLSQYWGQDNYTEFFPYEGNYINVLTLYIKMLKQYNSPYIKDYITKIEEAVKPNNKSYRLVRGANWYDRGSLLNGDEKKTFIAADSAHATLGFRYVVRFKEKK